MSRKKRNLVLGIGLSAALAVGCEPPAYETGTDTTEGREGQQPSLVKSDTGSVRQAGRLNKDQANELSEMVENVVGNVNKADMAINKNENDDARDHIQEAQSKFKNLKEKAQELGLAHVGSQPGSQSSTYHSGTTQSSTEYGTSERTSESDTTYGHSSESQMSQSRMGDMRSQTDGSVIRIPVYEGRHLVSLTRLISEARQQNGLHGATSYDHSTRSKTMSQRGTSGDKMATAHRDTSQTFGTSQKTQPLGYEDKNSKTYSHSGTSDTSAAYSSNQYGTGSTTSDRGARGNPSFVIVKVSDLDRNLITAEQAAQQNQFQQAEQALDNIQMQSVEIEYSASHRPLQRIGEGMSKARAAIEQNNFEEARTTLQGIYSEMEQFGRQASQETRSEIEQVRNDMQTWSNELEQNADEAEDKLEGWWNQMGEWFDTEITMETESSY